MALELALRWTHILSAIILLGGIFFLRFTVVPSMTAIKDQGQAEFEAACRSRWSKIVMITSGLLLASGLYNAVMNIINYEFSAKTYHGLVAVKLLLALGIFFITAILAGRTSTADRFRQNVRFWLNVDLLLAIALIAVAGLMKTSDRELKDMPVQSAQELRVEILAPKC